MALKDSTRFKSTHKENYKFWKIFLLKLVLFAIGRSGGVKNGKTVGMMLSTVQKDAVTESRIYETSINYFSESTF